MEKKTIGSFLAALRKSKGMTQQELADRLNVSNKTVSKWERDESYPEITLIPVIAEIFEVTSDEILRGERITKEEAAPDKVSVKADKQIKRILDSSLTRLKNVSMIAVALTLIGLIFLFTISYTFYKPVIGFGILLVFVVASILLEVIWFNIINASLQSNDLLTEEGELLITANNRKWKLVLHVLIFNVIAVIFAIPFILYRSSYLLNSVISWNTYISFMPALIVFSVIFYLVTMQFFKTKTEYGSIGVNSQDALQMKRMKQMNITQFCFIMVFFLMNLLAESGISSINYGLGSLLLIILAYMISTIIFVQRGKGINEKFLLFFAGARNFFCGQMVIYLLFLIYNWSKGWDFTIYLPTLYILLIFGIINLAGYLFIKKKLS